LPDSTNPAQKKTPWREDATTGPDPGQRDALSHRYIQATGQYETEKCPTYGPAVAAAPPWETHGGIPAGC